MRCLVTAIGSMSAEAVVQKLKRRPVTTVVGCSIHPKAWTSASRLVDIFYQVPPASNATAYVARLLDVCLQEGVSYVIPLTDTEVDALSEFRESFESNNITLCISSPSALRIARNKLVLHDRFVGNPSIKPIPTFSLHGFDPAEAVFPMIAKPSRGRSSEGIVRIMDPASLEFWSKRLAGKDYVLQPFRNGEVFVVDVVRQADPKHGCSTVAMARQELLRSVNGAGITVHMRPGHRCETLALEVAETLELKGCVNMEFLLDDGSPLLMDVNPRFSAGVAFSILAGYDMVTNHLRCFNGSKIAPSEPALNKIYTRKTVEISLEN